MTKDKSLKSPARRGFFSKAGRGAVGAAALALAATPAKAADKPADSRRDGSYRETDHVKAAYRTARF
jgi:hypothetical protein